MRNAHQRYCHESMMNRSNKQSRLYPMFRKASEMLEDLPLSALANGRNVKRQKQGSNNGARQRPTPTIQSSETENNTATVADSHKEAAETNNNIVSDDTGPSETNEAKDEQSDESLMQQNDDRRRHVLYQLVRRSTTGHMLKNPPPAHKEWSPWALLDTANAVVTCTAWDSMGVLLAVACRNKTVQIFDWDVVRAHRLKQALSPMCTFSTPHVVTNLQWNQHDCLGMTFRGSPQARVYNVANLVECSSSSDDDSCAITLQCAAIRSEAIAIQCLPRNQWLVSYRDGHLVLWKCKSSNTASMQWKWRQDRDLFSTIVPLCPTTVLLIGSNQWIQLDWKCCTRLAFSTEKTPTVLKRWNNSSAHQQYGTVQSLQVVTLLPLCIKWITSNGWSLSMNLETETLPTVIHGPPRVLLQTSSDSRKVSSQHYSQPLQPVAAYCTHDLQCWETVPAVTHVLPHHDRRNVGGSLQVVRSTRRSISIMDKHHRIMELSLQSSITTVTMHSSNEWLMVGNAQEGGLQVWTARKLTKRRKKRRQADAIATL